MVGAVGIEPITQSDSAAPEHRREALLRRVCKGHVTPEWVLQSNLRLLYGNHQEISDLRNSLRYRAPGKRSPLTC
jgi:hypothetical protein